MRDRGRRVDVTPHLGAFVAFDQFDPYKEDNEDPLAPTSDAAAQRVRVLRWGTAISTGMLIAGYLLLLYWIFF